MPKSRPITKEEFEAIKKSVVDARARLRLKQMGFCGGKRKSGSAKANAEEDALLRSLKWLEGRMIWMHEWSELLSILHRVVERGDLHFFVRLGRVLDRKAVPFHETRSISNLQAFLLDHWAERKDGLPELFYLTPDALWIACMDRLKLKRKYCEPDAVRTTVHRLGLKGFRRQKRDAVRIGGRLTFPPSYRK
jgi:hypothetical protein